MNYLLIFAAMTLSGAVKANQVFIEGFPDVPLLAGIEEHSGDRVVFDVPSGTVAETAIRAQESGGNVLDAYAKELPVFGWKCDRVPQGMRCLREKNVLVFLDQAPAASEALIILRLEPAS